MSAYQISKVITTDVLIIGGGGGGIWSAIEAVRSGAHVTMVSKGCVGNSGNTIMVGGSYAMDGESAAKYGYKGADPSMTKEFLLEQIVKQSFYLAEQDMAELFVYESPPVVRQTSLWCEEAKQPQTFMPPGAWLCSGRGLSRGLMLGLKKNPPAEIIDDVMVLDLLKADNRVIGAVGVNIYTGELIRFAAKAVVMATGGYQPFTLKSTNSDMTGDGMAIAFRAGARLSDMEFQLFMPTATEPEEYKGSLLPFMYEILSGVTLPSVDRDGKKIEVPHEMMEMAEGSELEKLINSYYWADAMADGRCLEDGSIYFDFSGLTDEEIIKSFDDAIEYMNPFYREGHYHGEDIRKYRDFAMKNRRVKAAAIDEYSMGGIVVNTNMETDLNGLYAAGEVGTGTFGACRVADAVVEMMVQGHKAGQTAGRYVKTAEIQEPHAAQVDAVISSVTAPLGRTGGHTGAEVTRMIEKAADYGFGLYRTEDRLKSTLEELLRIEREELPAASVQCASLRYNYDWIRLLQAKNLLTCTVAGVRAALMREESRGFHMRYDHQEVDNRKWALHIDILNTDGVMELTTRAPIVTRFPIPDTCEPTIPAFMKAADLNMKNANFAKPQEVR